LAAELKAQFA